MIRTYHRRNALISLLLTFSCLFSGAASSQTPNDSSSAVPRARTVVIIIDDLGNHLEAGKQAIALTGKLNMAILPHTPNSETLAELSIAAGKEVLLHAPMANLNAKPLGPGGLTLDMSEQQLRQTLAAGIESTPGIRGVSNHMGSQLTAQRQPMEWVMRELSERGL